MHATSAMTRPGFSLLETILAAVIGLVVLGTTAGIFAALDRTERAFDRTSRTVREVSVAQSVMRRAFSTIVLLPESRIPLNARTLDRRGRPVEAGDANSISASTTDEAGSEDVAAPGDAIEAFDQPHRVILEFDASPSLDAMLQAVAILGGETVSPFDLGFAAPQRLEMVLSENPDAGVINSSDTWSSAAALQRRLAYATYAPAQPPSEGGVRGCFELRPDGLRERSQLGLPLVFDAEDPLRRVRAVDGDRPWGWTLWWRPVSRAERDARFEGLPVDVDANALLLQEAVPILTGLSFARWNFTRQDPDDPVRASRTAEHRALTYRDLPAYAEFEFETLTGEYGNWLFEVIITVADEQNLGDIGDELTESEDGVGDGEDAGDPAGDALQQLEALNNGYLQSGGG